MPTLEWIGKRAVVNHHREVPYHLLEAQPELSAGDPESGNLLVQGDNLLALKALLPYYAGKVKLIYIDPPYNTGNESWVYNDNVNSPEIRAWLGKVVGPEAQDLSRHDKWLCMMYPRLCLLSQFLSEDGFLCVSISEEELAHLRLLLDEVMGGRNYRNALVTRRFDKNLNRQFMANGLKTLNVGVEYIVVYARSDSASLSPVFRAASEARSTTGYWKGLWNAADRPTMRYELLGVKPERGQWKWMESVAREAVRNYDKYERDFAATMTLEEYWDSTERALRFIRRNPTGTGMNMGVESWISPSDGILRSSNWTDLLASETLAGFGLAFDNPKNRSVIGQVVGLCADSDSLILDSFAGSGTTGHAVLEANRADGGNRRFILVELDETICRDVTAERLKRVIADGSGGEGLRYCTLAEPLFDARGRVRQGVTFGQLAAHVWFTETGTPLPTPADGATPLLGVVAGKAVYLLFNGVLRDRRPNGGNVLTAAVLESLPPYHGARVVYGEGCRLGPARLARAGIVFRQVPYGVRTD